MRLFTSVIASAIFLVASGASALTVFGVTTTVTGGRPLNAVLPGDTITLDIRLSGGTNVFGLGASVYGYSPALSFVTGQSVASINHGVCVPSFGCFSGLSNVLTNPLIESSIGASGNRVQIFNGVGLTATNSNPQDPGLDGVINGGGAQMRVSFTAVAGSTTIFVGTGYNGDGEVGALGATDTSANTPIAITVVPEPGTALMMGLGLAGLAAAGRKE